MAAGPEVLVEFGAAMAACGPFEPSPHVAVALSGGADSSALTLLLRDWTAARGGRVSALIVDHGLRPESAVEARQVAAWARSTGVSATILPWVGAKPHRAIQERARAARYALLEAWCRAAGVLHLCLGHHADDQDETVAMRAAQRSGADGLAGMAVVVERQNCRVLRPLLACRKREIRAWAADRAIPWVEDPSNHDPRFLRSRLRADAAGSASRRRCRAAALPAERRAAVDRAVSDLAARACTIRPEGVVRVDREAVDGAPAPVARRLLQRVLLTCSGRRLPPREATLDRFLDWLGGARHGAARTVAGCRVALRGGCVIVAREAAAIPAWTPATGEAPDLWDGRFRIGWRSPLRERVAAIVPGPDSAAPWERTLPAFQSLDGVVVWPQVFTRRGSAALVSVPEIDVTFRPAHAIGRASFFGPRHAALRPAPSPTSSPSARVTTTGGREASEKPEAS